MDACCAAITPSIEVGRVLRSNHPFGARSARVACIARYCMRAHARTHRTGHCALSPSAPPACRLIVRGDAVLPSPSRTLRVARTFPELFLELRGSCPFYRPLYWTRVHDLWDVARVVDTYSLPSRTPSDHEFEKLRAFLKNHPLKWISFFICFLSF